MNMINVKGTKNALPESDASQRYVQKSGDEVSRAPLVIGGLLAGVAAYLGSIFSWGREPQPPPQTKSGDTAAELLQAAKPAATAAEIETPAEVDQRASSPRRAQDDLSGSKSFSAGMSPVDDAPRSMPLRNSGDSGNMPFIAGPASENVDGARIGRSASAAGTPPADTANPEGEHSSPDGDGPSGTESPPEDDPLEHGDKNNEEDDDVEIRPDGNRAPRVSGPVYLLDVAPCMALLIAFDDLLRKAEDPDGDVLSVQNLSVSTGELTEVEGGWVFQSDTGQPGPVTLHYEITDGELTIDAVAHFSVVEQPVIEGSAANDMLLGSLCADEIDGAGGDDNIDGRAGNDVINGGAGDDHIVAGDGDDVVFGGDGNDIIFGGAGNDHLFGGSGDDRLFGGEGDDVIFGNAGEDLLSGGYGDDLLLGGDGNDVIMDGAGRDRVFGGMGNDRIVAALDADDDVNDGGGGTDTLDYSHATERLMVDLVNGVASGVEIGHDFITGFEKMLGGRGADQFIFGSESVALTGGAGDDVFAFASAGGERPNAVSQVIMDFGVGDRIRISEYDIFWKADESEDRFDQIYRDDDDDDLPIRYRHDRDDGSEWTVIETNFDDEMWATAVTLQGAHKLSWSTERDDSLEWLS
ncbi:calcium-binding protein [Vreelandella sulfidaeris]